LTFPEFRQLLEYFQSIYRAPIGRGQKVCCYCLLLPWTSELVKDLLIAADQVLYNLLVAKTVSTDLPQKASRQESKLFSSNRRRH
jgi:hypothetical protein